MIWVLLQSESPWQRNDAITFFIYRCVSQYQEVFWRNRLREYVPAIILYVPAIIHYGKVWRNSMRAFSRYFEMQF